MKRANPYPGLHRSPAKLADGSKRVYFYAWKGGPRLPDEYGSPAFAAAYRDAIAAKVPTPKGKLQSIIDAYQLAPSGDNTGMAFRDLAPRTKADYIKHIKLIEARFGTMPIAALADPRARAQFLEWRDTMATKSPRQADYTFSTLKRILTWAYGRRKIPANPCERAGKIYRGTRAESIWAEADIAAFYAIAPAHLHLALTLALWTGQRQGDILKLQWTAYDGDVIRLTQGKTGARVAIPVGEPLRRALDATPEQSATLFVNARGAAWTSHGFSSSWRKACAKAGITGVTFHDLRGTAVTRLAVAGCSNTEIGSITGHANAEVSAILEKHYLASDPAIAKSAIEKLERGEKASKRTPKRGMLPSNESEKP